MIDITKMTDQEKKEFKAAMAYYGYETYETDYFNTPSYRKLRATSLDYLPYGDEERFEFTFLPKRSILNAGRYVIDKHFGKLDLRVPYSYGDDLESQIVAIWGKKPEPDKYDDIAEYAETQCELVRVTDIPVRLATEQSKNGCAVSAWFYDTDDMEEDFYAKIPSCLHEIILDGDCDEDTQCIYVHEMGHALINRHKGNIRNRLNKETFPIFMEKVAASDLNDENDLLELETFLRIIQVKHAMLEKEIMEFREEDPHHAIVQSGYVLSTLHATALFNTYQKGSKKLQKEIDSSWGEVISGNAVLEDLLDHYEATPEKGAKIMQRQIKQFHKTYCEKA